ncbi:unnamed protein product [Hyaloperonospora brassicae]|uniref:Uncharacterized protein n=1 Tax=Hyaloperonospora brassicae TaxID=162125 RepID=A0AAV0V1Y5_HYABA|nr:unnamed protein product [Hyaloperonospora brassicae]
MTVHDLLIIPEIQEVLKRGVSEEQPVLDALSMYSYDSSTSASTYDKVADSMSEDAEENMQWEQHGGGGCYQLHSPVSLVVSPAAESDVTKKHEPRMPETKLDRSYKPADKTVQAICAAELRDLSREAQVRTASFQRSKQDKETASHQHHQIQELQSELFQLLQTEAQLVEYEQRSVDSIEAELQMCKEEIARLSGQVQEATQKELDWVAKLVDSCRV